jgi:hypothetical protein
MVLFIKRESLLLDDMSHVCKMMINMERNQFAYKMNGAQNTEATPAAFNKYMYKQVEYNINISYGVLLIYTDDTSITHIRITNILKEFFQNFDVFDAQARACVSEHNASTQYTLVNKLDDDAVVTSTCSHDKAKRRFIINQSDIKKYCSAGSKFNWFVNIIKKPSARAVGLSRYLHVAEYSKLPLDMRYLNRSTSTIIYDGINLFNAKSGTKQINYPSIKQYNLHTQNRLLNVSICVSNIYGLDAEIHKCCCLDKQLLSNQHSNTRKVFNVVDIDDFEIRRINKSKKWYEQIDEELNYLEQEDLESKSEEIGKPPFPDDICFITHVPLYANVYLLKVGKPGGIAGHANISYIMINAYVYHTTKTGKIGLSLEEYVKRVSGYDVMETCIIKYPRTELEVIQNIPSNQIDPIKKEIMECISKNGGFSTPSFYESSSALYTVNLEKNIIYVGTKNIYASDLCTHINSKTIIFRYDECD